MSGEIIMVPSDLELAQEWGQGVFEALEAGLTQPWFGSKQRGGCPKEERGMGLDDQLPLPDGDGVAVMLPGARKGLLSPLSCTMD